MSAASRCCCCCCWEVFREFQKSDHISQKWTSWNCLSRTFYRLDARPVTQQTAANHWRVKMLQLEWQIITEIQILYIHIVNLTRWIKSDLVLCYSVVHGHSCMKPPAFLFYVILVLLQDIILNCLSLSVVLMCGSIVLLTGLSISWTACQVILLMVIAFLYLNKKLESVDFTPLCFIVVLFSFVGHVSVSSGPVCLDFCLNKWIWI